MAWYTTGTIAVSGTTVTGTGTNWLDNKQSIGAGQALLIPGSGTVKMYEIASVTSATKLTLKTSPGTIAAGQAYAILSFYTDSVPDFARRLAAQLSYYQSQMDGWQQIMTGTGNVTLTAPDGTSVTISSFAKLTADVSSVLPRKGLLRNAGVSTVDALGPVDPYIGIWNCAGTSDYSIAGLPEATAGALENYDAGNYNSMQRYTTRNGNVWVRCLAAAWSASSPSWTSWCLVGDQPVQGYISTDLNTVLSPGTYSVTTAAANLPVNAAGILEVKLRLSTNSVKQTFTTIVTTASTINRTFQRTLSGTTWSAWAEVMTSNDSRITGALQSTGGTVTGTLTSTTTSSAISKPESAWNASSTSNQIFTVRALDSRWSVNADFYQGANYFAYRMYSGDPNNGIKTWEFRTDGTLRSPGSVYANGTALTSDKRLKSDFADVEINLDDIDKFKPQTYTKKNPDNDEEITHELGIVAQSLEAAIPSIVSSFYWNEKYPDLRMVNYSSLTAWLAGYCKILKDAVIEHDDKVSKIELRMAELEARLKALDGLDS